MTCNLFYPAETENLLDLFSVSKYEISRMLYLFFIKSGTFDLNSVTRRFVWRSEQS